jgi:hypothetical protein
MLAHIGVEAIMDNVLTKGVAGTLCRLGRWKAHLEPRTKTETNQHWPIRVGYHTVALFDRRGRARSRGALCRVRVESTEALEPGREGTLGRLQGHERSRGM